MLHILFGFDTESIRDIDLYFDNVYDEMWLKDDLVKRMVEDVDHSEVVSENCIVSPALGQIPPERLSGGVKALICMYKCEEAYIDLIVCGPNCEKWIAKIAEKKDIKVGLSGYDLTFKHNKIKAHCINDDSIIHNQKEWVEKMCEFVEADYEG